MRTLLLAGAAFGALMAGAAHAQVQSGLGFFGYLDGMYHFDPGRSSGVRLSDFPGLGAKTNGGDGWGFEGRLGWRFNGNWDVALAGRYSDFSAGDTANNNAGAFRVNDAKLWNLDLELGYTLSGPSWGVRPALGVRFLRYRQEASDALFGIEDRLRSWGIGPHVGVDGALRLTESFSLIGGVDTAFLFGKVRNSHLDAAGAPTGAKDGRFIWQVGAKLGIDWEVAPLVHLVAGYRVQFNDGVRFQTIASGPFFAGGTGRGSLLEHGPFVRLAYNWGAPPPGVAPAAPTPPAATRSFIVFFDFDRATLTATAVQTIRQAADQAKGGRSTRVDVTGHTDRAGPDAYNMALSLRRANAVKDQLVREGIAASQIVVVGRGETQPLVPTADGVREPQNRRVEIVLG